MSLPARLLSWCLAGLMFAGIGAMIGTVFASVIGIVVFQPALAAGFHGLAGPYAMLIAVGAAGGAVAGLVILIRLKEPS